MFKSALSILAATAALSGCISVNSTRLDSAHYAPTNPANVQVFVAAEDVPKKCKKIALLSARGATGYTDESDMIAKVKEEAAKAGADAVLLKHIEEPSAGAKVAGAVFGVAAERTGQMIALRCK